MTNVQTVWTERELLAGWLDDARTSLGRLDPATLRPGDPKIPHQLLGPLDAPFLTVFRPPAGKANGGAVVIAPGGSNIMLMYGAEGADVAEIFNDWGVTAFVFTYRLSPRYDNDTRTRDAERAMRLVRANAARWKLDAAKIGFVGFSAGGSLARAVVAASDGGNASARFRACMARQRSSYARRVR